MNRIILDLCGATGSWSKNYKEAGFIVIIVTLPDYDILQTVVRQDYIVFRGKKEISVRISDVYGILAAPVCTMFSFARTRAETPRDFRQGMKLVIACLDIIWECRYRTKLAFWCLENPTGYLRQFLGKPVFTFNPYDFGNAYQKKTDLWGYFNMPKKSPIKNFSKDFIHTISPTGKPLKKFDQLLTKEIAPKFYSKLTRQERRAITPQGFAKAFFEANR